MASEKTTFLSSMGCMSALVGIGLSIFLMIRASIFMGICFGIVLIVVSIILFARSHTIQEANRASYKRYIESFTSKQSPFSASQAFTADSLLCRVAIDKEHQRIGIWQPQDKNVKKPVIKMPFNVYIYPYTDILGVKMFVDGKMIASSVHENSEQTINEKISMFSKLSSLVLNIQTREKEHALILYSFVPENGNNYLYKESEPYRIQLETFLKWYGIFARIANQNNGIIVENKTSASYENAMSQLVLALKKVKEQKQNNEEPNSYQTTTSQLILALDKVKEQKQINQEPIPSEETQIHGEMESISSLSPFEYEYEYDFDSPKDDPLIDDTDDSSNEDENPFADFERFLEENKQKQQGRE